TVPFRSSEFLSQARPRQSDLFRRVTRLKAVFHQVGVENPFKDFLLGRGQVLSPFLVFIPHILLLNGTLIGFWPRQFTVLAHSFEFAYRILTKGLISDLANIYLWRIPFNSFELI